MKIKHLALTLLPILLSSCNPSPKGSNTPAFKRENIQVHYSNKANDTTVGIRYYGDSVIPYISFKDYQQLLYRGRTFKEGRDKLDIKQNGNVYEMTVAGDYTATFDVANNKMDSSNLWCFKNTNLAGYGDISSVCYDGLPFTKVSSVRFEGETKKTTIDFSKYHMKIYGDNQAVYVPLPFITDLFSSENILQGAYNHQDLFIFNMTENESLDDMGDVYYNGMYSKPLVQEYTDFVYNELCLNYDLLLGRPGRSSLEVYYDLSKGLDEALKSRPLGQTIINYMKSNDLTKFLVGETLFGYLHEDGGHSHFSPLNVYYTDPKTKTVKDPSWLSDKLISDAKALLQQISDKKYEELVNYDVPFNERSRVYSARSKKLSKPDGALKGTETYTKDGNIAYIHIDGFMGEIALANEWQKYYKGERKDIPFGEGIGGAVGAIHYGVLQASKDNEIEHVVIDLGGNSGGSTDEMLFMIYLLTGSKEFYSYNSMSDNYNIATYDFDLNLDRVFDEKDEEMLTLLQDKDISVLTTKNGFSCGGIAPIYLHDEDLFTIGNDCGGGSCSVFMQYDGYGNYLRSSSPSMTVNKSFVNIDEVREGMCDCVFTFPDGEQGKDYSDLYDTAKLREVIEEHYGTK